MLPRNVLGLLALMLTLPLSGCGGLYPKLVDRQPDASLLVDCRVPPDPPPGKLTYGQVVLAWLDAVKAALDCRDEKRALADFVSKRGD